MFFFPTQLPIEEQHKLMELIEKFEENEMKLTMPIYSTPIKTKTKTKTKTTILLQDPVKEAAHAAKLARRRAHRAMKRAAKASKAYI